MRTANERFNFVLSRLYVEKNNDNSALCRCPVHHDKHASLQVSKGRQKIVLRCFADCSYSEILSALGLTDSDLQYEEQGKRIPKGEFWINTTFGSNSERYDYFSVSGGYVYSRIRFYNSDGRKQFISGYFADESHERFICNSGCLGSVDLASAFYCPYSLAEVKAKICEKQKIFVVEGEKDAKTLYKYGFCGVSLGSSSLNFTEILAKFFEGAEIVILSDFDSAGERASQRWKEQLSKYADSVRVVIPCQDFTGADITDFFNAGKTKADFERLINPKEWQKAPLEGGSVALYEFFVNKKRVIAHGESVYLHCGGGKYELDDAGRQLKAIIEGAELPEQEKADLFYRILAECHQVENPKYIYLFKGGTNEIF